MLYPLKLAKKVPDFFHFQIWSISCYCIDLNSSSFIAIILLLLALQLSCFVAVFWLFLLGGGYRLCTVFVLFALDKVKLLGLGLPLTCMLSLIIYLAFRYKPHIFWSTAPFSMIFSAGEFKIHALSTQASEKSAWLFSPFRFGQFLAIVLICILLHLLQLSCFVAVFWF